MHETVGDRATLNRVHGAESPPDPRAFRWEHEMFAPLLPSALALASTSRRAATGVAVELSSPAGGVPDVVAVCWDVRRLSARQRAGLGPVEDLAEAQMLTLLTQGASINTAADLLGTSASILRRTVVRRLAVAGWLDGKDARLVHPFRPLCRRVVTIEAKRSEWRRALHQAIRHGNAAHAAYVALDAARMGAATGHADAMARLGVGLLSVDALTHDVQVVRQPAATARGDDIAAAVMGERVWARLLAGTAQRSTAWPVFGRVLQTPDLSDEQVLPEREMLRNV